MSFLGEHSDRFVSLVSLQGDGGALRVGGLDSASRGRPSEFSGAGHGLGRFSYLLDPFGRSAPAGFLLANPVPHPWLAIRGSWVPRNVGDDEVFVLLVDGVEAHPQCG